MKVFITLFILMICYDVFAVSMTTLGRPATDLVFDNDILTIPEAIELRERGTDLSKLDPSVSDIWKKKGFQKENLNINGDTFIYESVILSRLGNFRFISKNEDSSYIFLLGKKSFTTLLRNELLHKLGYKTYPMKRLGNMTLNFSSKGKKDQFIADMGEATYSDPRVNRWVVSEDDTTVVLQDIVVFPAQKTFYNLAIGTMKRDTTKGRRVLNSLLLPFSLLDIPESINLLPFEAHKIYEDNLLLPYALADEFSPNIEDIKWVANKITKLTRSDWTDIVKAADLPQEVEKLLVEKIIARRNALTNFLDNTVKEIEIDSEITIGENLIKGKLQKEFWNGYGSRFAYGDPETPLNSSEIKNFFKSKGISNIIANAMTFFNTKFLTPDLNTDSIIRKQYDKARLDYLFRVFEGKSKKTDLYFFSFPTVGGQVITSRRVNIGGINGGESKIMLADSFGYRINGAYRFGTFDFPIARDIKAGTDVGVSRVYTHLTPLLSLKKALKTPFKNIIVNWSQKKTYQKCNGILELNIDIPKEKIDECFKVIDENFEVGESLIITDSIDLGGNFRYTQHLDALLKVSAEITAKSVTLKRTHLHRVSKEEFHLYVDHGIKGVVGLRIGLEYGIQVLSIGRSRTLGKLGTKFYPWKQGEANNKLKFIKGLTRILKDTKSDFIRSQQNPFRVNHGFNTKQTDFNFLIWKNQWRSDYVSTEITHKDDLNKDFTKKFLTYSRGKRKGRNYAQVVSNSLGEIFTSAFDDDRINIDLGNDRDPANTPFGHSYTKNISFEGEVTNGVVEDPSVDMDYSWRGWKITKRKAKSIVRDINEKFSYPFFNKNIFHQTENIQVYNINFKITLYKDFIDKLTSIKRDTLRPYLEKNYPRASIALKSSEREMRINSALRRIEKYQKAWFHKKNSDMKDAVKSVTKLVQTLESHIPFQDLVKIVGSDKYFAVGSIHGFRQGDENGDQSYFSHGLGKVGSQYSKGKMSYMRNVMGIIPNEFYGYWFIGKL